MPIPTPDQQVTFLVKLQRVLAEGAVVSSYKFALLLALADLSVEAGDDSGNPLPITLDALAENLAQRGDSPRAQQHDRDLAVASLLRERSSVALPPSRSRPRRWRCGGPRGAHSCGPWNHGRVPEDRRLMTAGRWPRERLGAGAHHLDVADTVAAVYDALTARAH